MDDYKELIERLRYERDDGSRNEAANAIESLLAENERFKYERDLAVQKMKDGWVRICNSGIQYYVVENAKLQAELAKYRDAPKYGCHCDLEDHMEPDGCVIDIGNLNDCVYAKRHKSKEQCQYWRPIRIVKPDENK